MRREKALLALDLCNFLWIIRIFIIAHENPQAKPIYDPLFLIPVTGAVILHLIRWRAYMHKPWPEVGGKITTYSNALDQCVRLHLGQIPYLISPILSPNIYSAEAIKLSKRNIELNNITCGELFLTVVRIPTLQLAHLAVLVITLFAWIAGAARAFFGALGENFIFVAFMLTAITGIGIYSFSIFIHIITSSKRDNYQDYAEK